MNQKIMDYLNEESKTALLCTGEHFTRFDVLVMHIAIIAFIVLTAIISSLG